MDILKARKLIEQNKKVYNAIASRFSRTRDFLWDDLKIMRRFVTSEDTIVDLGCGNGRLYQLFRDLQVNYIGIDQSDELIRIARERFPGERFLVADMRDTHLKDNIADVVFCIAALQHMPTEETRVGVLKEMKRILKPGGTIVMLNWNLYSDWARKKYVGNEQSDFMIPWKDAEGNVLGERYYHGFFLEELHDLATAAGLEIVEQYYIKKGEVKSIGTGENIFTVIKERVG